MELLAPLFAKYVRASGLTHQQIGAAAGFSKSIVSKILRGKRGIRTKHAAAWCVALRLNREDTLRLTKAIHLAQASGELQGWIRDLERRTGQSL